MSRSTPKVKDYRISLIRLLAFASIIACHILQGLGNSAAFWVNLGVQVFFFISGFLYGKKDITDTKTFYLTRLTKILFPASVLVFIMFIIDKVVLGKTYDIIFFIGSMLGFGGFQGNPSTLSNLWFVSYILLCYFLTPFLQRIFKKEDSFKKNAIRLILLVILVQMLRMYRVIAVNPAWINNYILAYFFGRCCISKSQKLGTSLTVFILTILILPIVIILQEKLNIHLPSIINSYANYFKDYGHMLMGSSIFIILYFGLEKLSKIKHSILLDFTDQYSYHIYLVHQIFILGAFSILRLTDNLFLNIVLICFASIFTGVLLKVLTDVLLKIPSLWHNRKQANGKS